MSLHKYLYGNANPVTYTDPTGLFSAAEAQAAADIASTLAAIQWESGGYLVSATLARGNYAIGDLLRDFSFSVGGVLAGRFFAYMMSRVSKTIRGRNSGNSGTSRNSGPVCFVAGTKVLTDSGKKPIETLTIGDLVASSEPVLGIVENHKITQVFKREATRVVDIQIGDVTITCTPEHPFWVPGRGWLEAGALQVGTLLLTKDKQTLSIDSLSRREGAFKVYNIEVEDLHTYYVSNLDILVHNECAGTFHDASRPLKDEEALSHAVRVYNRQQVSGKDLKGALPGPGGQAGHALGKHKAPNDEQADIINNPERVFIGINDAKRQVTVFYRNGRAFLTQDNDFTRVITAYGEGWVSKKPGGKEVPGKYEPASTWLDNPNYDQILL
jgi:hypothetical protein